MKRLLLAATLLLAGCGGAAQPPQPRQPHLPRALAQAWRAQADAVAAALAAGDGCTAQARAAELQSSVIAAVNAHRVSPRFQEALTGAVNDLASRIGCTPPAPPPPPAKGHGKDHGHGHGKGHGKKDE